MKHVSKKLLLRLLAAALLLGLAAGGFYLKSLADYRRAVRQRVDVDAVSGATNSSRVLQKAVEQALWQGLS